MFNKSLTIVLPVHNAEGRLRKNVGELLELASELTAKFGVLIVDDGSTDATYEVAEELASCYPQVSVRRNRQYRGLGATIDYVQRRVRSDAVIVHDGVTPINAQNVRTLWRQWTEQQGAHERMTTTVRESSRGMSEFVNLSAIHAAMERAHRQVVGFQLIAAAHNNDFEPDGELATKAMPRTDGSHDSRRGGVGRIPLLPRPKFLSAIAEFALGE